MLWTALLLSAQAFASDATFPYPVTQHTLDNGLRIAVVPMPTPNAVAVYTWFEVGSRDEVDPGRTGFAHFFEHLAFYGTPTWPPDRREEQLLRMGAEENAWTWLDETVYHTVLPAAHLDAFLAMEALKFLAWERTCFLTKPLNLLEGSDSSPKALTTSSPRLPRACFCGGVSSVGGELS